MCSRYRTTPCNGNACFSELLFIHTFFLSPWLWSGCDVSLRSEFTLLTLTLEHLHRMSLQSRIFLSWKQTHLTFSLPSPFPRAQPHQDFPSPLPWEWHIPIPPWPSCSCSWVLVFFLLRLPLPVSLALSPAFFCCCKVLGDRNFWAWRCDLPWLLTAVLLYGNSIFHRVTPGHTLNTRLMGECNGWTSWTWL